MDFGKMEVQYFCTEGWTGEIRLKSLGKIAVLARHCSECPAGSSLRDQPLYQRGLT
jgi:hypothetical protein